MSAVKVELPQDCGAKRSNPRKNDLDEDIGRRPSKFKVGGNKKET